MCGIFAYLGKKTSYREVKSGLERLSYRGYDSAGILSVEEGSFKNRKCIGHPENLPSVSVDSNISIGHNRWATHGGPSIKNAHPHISNNGEIALVHNGIVENYSKIRDFLASNGFKFYSDTDTELIPNLIQYYMDAGLSFSKSIMSMAKDIEGAYSLVIIHKKFLDRLTVVRFGSPVCVGQSKSSTFISSDIQSFPVSVTKGTLVDNGKILTLFHSGDIEQINLHGESEELRLESISINSTINDLENYSSYLEKEIFEQPLYYKSAISGRVIADKNIVKLAGISDSLDKILSAEEIIYTGCGSAFYAAQVGAYAMENLARKRCRAIPAGELKYYNAYMNDKTVLVAISQSGETADTIGCIELAKECGVTSIGIVNTVNSTISKIVDSGVYIRAGKETSVASTKAVLNQMLAMISMSIMCGTNGGLSKIDSNIIINEIYKIESHISSILSNSPHIYDVAAKYYHYDNMICIGRGNLTPMAKELALKIKEISYIHAEGYSAAELKHGPLALISEEMPTVALVDSGLIGDKMLSNIREIKSRGGSVLGIISEDCDEEIVSSVDEAILIPSIKSKVLSPMLFVVACQLFAYHTATLRGASVDRPRNLAKSVTVE